MRILAAFFAGSLFFNVFAPAAVPPDDASSSARKWFATEGNKLAAAATMYLPEEAVTSTETKPEVGEITQVSAWSKEMLKGTYSPRNATEHIDMWVSPITQSGTILGVVVYTGSETSRYPLPLPKDSKLAPKITEGIPEPTTKPAPNPSMAVEPKNSHLPVKSSSNGAVYILPELARALVNGAKNTRRPSIPIYDPVIDGWFIRVEEQLTPVSVTACSRLSGSATLVQVRDAIQSWWGTAKVTPAPQHPETTTAPAPTAVWIVLAALFVSGLVALLIWLSLRRQSKAMEEVVPLPDPDLIIVPPPPPTTAIPTMPVSPTEAQ